MRILASLAGALLAPCVLAPAQETYWVASRNSQELHEVSVCGEIVNTILLPSSLRSAHVAPDGRIWVVRFIQAQFDILNPDGTVFASPMASLGSPFDIAFDNQGTAWISGGTGVEQFDANGVSIQTIPLATGAPLGITIDAQGNKWVAHRVGPPGSVSRIDPGGNVTVHPMPMNSLILPTRVMADARGTFPMITSNIWVVGDNRGAGELIELDSAGNPLNLYVLDPGGNLGSLTFDLSGYIYAGDFRNGNIHQFDPSSGSILNTILSPPNVLGLSTDSFGRVWSTSRITFSGTGPPCEVRRIDPATGNLEFPALVGIGTQSALSTRFEYAYIVAPLGDVDGDGVPNAFELQAGVSPFDSQSTGFASINASGVTAMGSTANVNLRVQPGASTLLFFGFGSVAPGSGVTVPGITGEVLLSPPGIIGGVFLAGSTSLPVAIPGTIGVGLNLKFQGLTVGSTFQFTNVTCIETW